MHAVVNAVNLDGGGSATMTQNHSLVSDPSWLCDSDNPLSLFRCEKPVATITCIHAAPPPVFLPLEATWPDWPNVSHARAEAAAAAAARAKEETCRGYYAAVLANATSTARARWARLGGRLPPPSYEAGFWVLLPLLLLSALLNLQLLPCCGRSKVRSPPPVWDHRGVRQ
jgi:hypothetical protein